MIPGIYKYIEKEYAVPTPVYSDVYYIEATAGVATINHLEQGARAILIHYIYFIAVSEAGAPMKTTFKDQYGKVLFSTQAIGTGWAPLPLIQKKGQLKITATPAVQFNVSYQYIM